MLISDDTDTDIIELSVGMCVRKIKKLGRIEFYILVYDTIGDPAGP